MRIANMNFNKSKPLYCFMSWIPFSIGKGETLSCISCAAHYIIEYEIVQAMLTEMKRYDYKKEIAI